MRIGLVADKSGLSEKTIRYYEHIVLVRPARGMNGYRDFVETDVHKLRFLARARALGFSIKDCRMLLSLYEDRERASADVKEVAQRHLRRIDRKIAELDGLRGTLGRLVALCHGDERPECPILEDLAGPEADGDTQ